MRIIAGLIGSLAGAVIRWRTRCPEHVASPSMRPATCGNCFQVLETFTGSTWLNPTAGTVTYRNEG